MKVIPVYKCEQYQNSVHSLNDAESVYILDITEKPFRCNECGKLMQFTFTNCDNNIFLTNINNFNTTKVIIIIYISQILLSSPGKYYMITNITTQNKSNGSTLCSPKIHTSVTQIICIMNSLSKSRIREVNLYQCSECGLLNENANYVKVILGSKCELYQISLCVTHTCTEGRVANVICI